ncbi:hypothetical protein M409DRAFT_26569 [Zasmidium cellare ATCC 36951]|uniref:Uncharacterized protein n=1 Tax=Zasmidium cellare ATCC 36951 TaxID=1080233 RepID=A0A6A6C7P5_ZASCE|nr:uncharacterized protein M409DRAFT_26569 [Zasmidium cellare ATCC 36951]KAF2163124.1 hypothetical protein M409DRAFT_26569 [Zasmidium cellare ATCC 36951]
MPYTIYEGFVRQTHAALSALSNILHKAEQHPNASRFPTSRLYDDMKSLSYQVLAATSQTTLALARLNKTEAPTIDLSQDVTYSYEEMQTRIQSALAALDAIDKQSVLVNVDIVEPTNLGPFTAPMSVEAYLRFQQANIFFQITTAYAILRKEGVPLGKADYITPFVQVG